jgi:hypothetical protein
MNINLISLPMNIMEVGDELAIFDGTFCVGAVTLMPHNLNSQTVSISVSANDNQGMTGFAEGNLITLKLWSKKINQEFVLDPEILKGASTFVKHETTIASLEKYATTGLKGLVSSDLTDVKCYPNPFSDEITVEIKLTLDSEVSVEILNQLGQQVKFIATKQILTSGLHKFTWNGKNANNQTLSPGIYHLKLIINEKEIHKKIVHSI